jgi:1-acyl-sn-glycerol-3-phosphate acyltransferase
MIKAAPDFWGRYFFRPYFQRSLRRAFQAAYFWGWEHWKEVEPDEPVLAFANHSGWWDGIVLIHLMERFPQRQFYCMMEHLSRYSFFRRLGAYSINLRDRREAASSLRYTCKLLTRPRSVVWIFPQGRLLPVAEPFKMQKGFQWILKKHPKIKVMPLGLRYGFTDGEKPVVYGAWGKALYGELCSVSGEAVMEEILKFLDARLKACDASGAIVTLPPRSSINERWDQLRRKLGMRVGS